MEKLRPLLEQKFWILSGVSLILVVAGWWLGTGNLSAKYTERETILNGLNIPSGNSPNKDWCDKMSKIVDTKKKRLDYSARYLRNQQSGEDVRYWPASMAKRMKGVPFRYDIDIEGLEFYRQDYFGVTLPAVKQIVDPYDMKTGKGKCKLDIDVLPQVPPGQWDVISPNSTEVWNAQLDIWLTSSLLNAVASTNQHAKGIANAPIKVISLLELHSGNRDSKGTTATGASASRSAGTNDPSEEEGYPGMDPRGQGGGGLGGGQPGGGTGGTTGRVDDGLGSEDIAIDLVSEFGTGDATKLYVNDDPKMPFKTRGFYLKVVMDRNKLPHFLAQLTSLKYPVEIVQVKQASRKTSTSSGSKQGGQGEGRPMGEPMGKPMGIVGGLPMAPMGKGFGAPGVIQLSTEEEMALQTFDRALNKPEMSEIAIAGLMTIYTPKEDKEKKDGKPIDNQPKNNVTIPTPTKKQTPPNSNPDTIAPNKKTPLVPAEGSSKKNKLPVETKPGSGKTPVKTEVSPPSPIENKTP